MAYAWAWTLSQVLSIVLFDVVLLVMIAYFLLADRKIFAAVQMRRGPNVVGIFGLLQSFSDLGKYLIKEVIIPSGANKVIFILAPLVTATLAFAGWAVVPLDNGWVFANINVGILYLFAMSSMGVYGVIMAGWASNSKYPFLSALRAAAQMVSYEVSIGFVMITVLLFAGSLNLSAIVLAQRSSGPFGFLHWNMFSILFPMMVIFFVSAIAETNRPPFDLIEAEIRTRGRLLRGIFLDAVPAVLSRRVSQHCAYVRDPVDPVPRRMATAVQFRAVHARARRDLVHPQNLFLLLPYGDGAFDRTALSL